MVAVSRRYGILAAVVGAYFTFTVWSGRAAFPQSLSAVSREAQLDSLFHAGAFQSVVDSASRYLADAVARDDSLMIGRLLTALGRAEIMLGDPDGISNLERSIAVSRAVRDTTNWMTALGYKSLLFSYQGRYDESRELNVERLELAQLAGDRASEAWARTMLGYIALLRGDLENARVQYTSAVEAFFHLDMPREALTPLLGLGRVYNSLPDVDRARECYQRVLDTAREVGDRVNEVHAVNNLGTLEYEYGDMELAVQYYERSREMAAASGNLRGTITPAANIALAMQYVGRYGEADTTLTETLELCEREGFDEFIPMLLNRLGENHFLRNRFHSSVKVYRRLLDMGDALPRKEHDEAVYGLARSLTFVGRPQEALEVLENSFDTPPVPTLAGEVDWAKSDCLLELGRPGEALAYALAAEHRAVSSGTAHRTVATALLLSLCNRRLGRLDEAMTWFETAVSRFATRQSSKRDFAWREAVGGTGILVDASGVILEMPGVSRRRREAQLFDLFQQFKVRTLVDRITEPRRQDDPASRFAAIRPVTLQVLQRGVLEPGELFLDFAVGEKAGYLFAVTRDSCRVVEVPGEYSRFAKRVAVYRNVVAQRPERDAKVAVDHERMNRSMSSAILGGVEDLVRSASEVVVSPASFYGGIPFGALSLDGRSLIETKTLQRVPSATVLAWLRSQEASRGPGSPVIATVAPVGEGTLAGARREVNMIQRRYNGVNGMPGFKNADLPIAPGGIEVVHVAAHIEVNDEKPWHSGILVGSANGDGEFQADLYLRAGDIASRRLPARLAVLSGCESAMGQAVVGEGVAGLTSAFLSAGVQSVVATLWQVDDAVTADLMERFYRALGDGLPVAGALRRAQLETRDERDTGHPFYWVGFVVVGAGDVTVEIEEKPGGSAIWLLWVVLGAMAIAAAVWIAIRFKRL